MDNETKEVPIGNRSVVVRITDFCNNECKHCCFSCSPKNTLFMDISTANKINDYFQQTQDTKWWFNVMGGEPTLHPKYEEIINSFCGRNIRLVTNGWWIRNEAAKKRFIDFLNTTKAIVHIGVSRDKFHPPEEGKQAYEYLMSLNFKDDFGLSAPDPVNEEKSIAMVGRAWWNEIGDYMLNHFNSYCHSSNTRNTSFTVLEDGTVTHCPFGIIPIGNIHTSTMDKLCEKKCKIGEAISSNMISCYSCYMQWEMGGKSRSIKNGYLIYEREQR